MKASEADNVGTMYDPLVRDPTKIHTIETYMK